MHHHGNNDKWGSHAVDVVTGSCNIIVAFILSNWNIFNWGLNQPWPDDRRSLKLWRPANQRGRRTSWCRCLPADTLEEKRDVVSLTHRDTQLSYVDCSGGVLCLLAYMWCLSPSTRRTHTGRSGAANWDGSAQRLLHFSDVPGLCRRPLQSALRAWRDKRSTNIMRGDHGNLL